MKKIILAVAASTLLSGSITATVWNVGPSLTYTKPSQVTNLVQNGDTVYIAGGVYLNDAATWRKKNLKIIGLGPVANRTILRHTAFISNGKGIFLFDTPGSSDNAYVENIVFDGGMIDDGAGGNGAGIRFQAVNLTVNNCKFINCQNGILEGHSAVSTSNVILQNSEFENNGHQLPNHPTLAGQEHHIYIGSSTDTLIVTNCYFHRPRGQANTIKTRAQRSFILYNLIDEEATGNGSWEIHLAEGGLNIIMGNVIIQGTNGANHAMIGYQDLTRTLQDLYFVNNTIINKYAGIVKYFYIFPTSGINTFKLYNNVFATVPGSSTSMYAGTIPLSIDTLGNKAFPDYLTVGFTNPAANDYSLLASATAIINKGVPAGLANTGYPLLPTKMYKSNILALLPRVTSGGTIDVGAYEFASAGTVAVAAINAASTGCVGTPIALTDASTAGPTSWTWNTAGGTPASANTQNASVTYATAGVKTITLTVSNAYGTTTATKSITITAAPVVATSITNTTICKGASTVVSVTGATSYAWLPSGSGSSSTLSPAATTIYTITGTTGGCTSAKKTVTITVTPTPTTNITASAATICSGKTSTLTASGATSYSWTPGAQTTPVITVSPVVTTTYTVKGTSGACSSNKTFVVSVTPNPTISATASSTAICSGQTATLTAGGATSYVWSPAASLNNSTSSAVVSSAIITTTYTVVGTSSGCSTSKTVVLKVNTCTGIEDLTTTDGISVFPNPSNGLFTISTKANMSKFEVVVINTLGQTVMTESGNNVQQVSFDLSKHSKGIYYAKVTTSDGTKLFKLILE